ncbi:MAG: S9 family peptidase [Elusimicrobiales bacterium]
MKFLLIALSAAGAARAAVAEPPVAAISPYRLEKFGDVRIDNYYWLRDRENPAVRAYLEAENNYADAVLAPQAGLAGRLFEEMKSRVKETDSSVPYRLNGYYYYERYEKDRQYPILCRKKGNLDAPEEIIADVNELAKGHDYYLVAGPRPSPDGNIIAWGADDSGDRVYTIYFKDMRTGKMLEDAISNTGGDFAWANDNKTLFYGSLDKTLRGDRIMRHILGSAGDAEVYAEKDETFEVTVSKSLSDKYIFMHTANTLSSECLLLEADNPGGAFRVFAARRPGVEYSVYHGGGCFFVLTNDNAGNFRFCRAPEDKTSPENWKDAVAGREDTLIESAIVFDRYFALGEKRGGLSLLHVFDRASGRDAYAPFQEPAYTVALGDNAEYGSPLLRFEYESPVTPPSVYDYDMASGSRELKKREEVPGYNPDDYRTERVFAPASGGAQVPVTLLYRRDLKRDGTHPLFITGYGSYGDNYDPDFEAARLPLLDRGFVFAIAHIRGGSEMGRPWYDNGRQLGKKNTFNDFIAATEFLIKEKYCAPGHVYAEGGSAGGLLMGAIANMRPDLYNGIIARVPFVDVITTMLDPSIPLTTGEYDQWGNPGEKQYYDYIRTYSPYDNVRPQKYPALLVTAGWNDSQVGYWEPAKWVAKLRAANPGGLALLKTEMKAGHHAKTGRYEQLKKTAFYYSFIFKLEGVDR